jgi:gliding motility-associated-like protein
MPLKIKTYYFIWTRCLCPICLLLFISVLLKAQTIYLTNANDLYRLDLEHCTYELVVNVNFGSIADITFHPDGTLYGIEPGGKLFEIDTITGNTIFVYDFPGLLFGALTSSNDGIIYSADRNGELWSYDKSTGIGTDLGNVGYGYAGDLAFYYGELYMSSVYDDLIIKIDIDNPANSKIVMTDAGGMGGGMYGIVTYARDCNDVRFYGIVSGNYTVVEIDLNTMTNDTICILDRLFAGAATSHEFIASAPVKAQDTVISNPDCGLSNGVITLTATGGTSPYEYSLNGSPPQIQNSFQNLSAGQYQIVIIDSRGCFSTINIVLIPKDILLIDSIRTTNKTCGNINGEINITPLGSDPLHYSIDSLNFQSSNIFDKLNEGIYNVYVRNDSGCLEHKVIEILSIPPAIISDVQVIPTTCGQANGALKVLTAGVNSIKYSINDLDFQNGNEFSQLPYGEYVISIIDENGCTDERMISILQSTSLILDTVKINNPSCGLNNGALDINIIGATGQLSYTLNGSIEQMNSFFTQLSDGSYNWLVTDEVGCMVTGDVELINADVFSIEKIITTNTACGEKNGSIDIEFSNPDDTITISINGVQIDHNLIEMLAAGIYDLSFTDENGCSEFRSVTIDQNPCEIFIPNIFSPNGDGINDYFRIISGDNQSRIMKYLIFDRWGNLVYSAGDFLLTDQGSWWDGNFKNIKASPGTYAYFIEIRNNDGSKSVYKGDIALVK